MVAQVLGIKQNMEVAPLLATKSTVEWAYANEGKVKSIIRKYQGSHGRYGAIDEIFLDFIEHLMKAPDFDPSYARDANYNVEIYCCSKLKDMRRPVATQEDPFDFDTLAVFKTEDSLFANPVGAYHDVEMNLEVLEALRFLKKESFLHEFDFIRYSVIFAFIAECNVTLGDMVIHELMQPTKSLVEFINIKNNLTLGSSGNFGHIATKCYKVSSYIIKHGIEAISDAQLDFDTIQLKERLADYFVCNRQ